MKPLPIRYLILLLGLLLLFQVAAGQVIIFKETMGDFDHSQSDFISIAQHELNDGFDNVQFTMTDGGADVPAVIRRNNMSTGYPGCSKYANVFFETRKFNCGFAIEDIDVSQYVNLKIQFGYRKENTIYLPTVNLSFWNGQEYVDIPFVFNELPDSPNKWYLSPVIELPQEAQINGLKLRWINSGNTSFRIDDVVLTGEPVSSMFFVDPPEITGLNAFYDQEPSIPQLFTLTGDLSSVMDAQIDAPVGFEISDSENGGFYSSMLLSDYNGEAKNLWVRLKENNNPGFYEGQISVCGANALGAYVKVSGWVVEPFDIPFFCEFDTPDDFVKATIQGFNMVSGTHYSPEENGCLIIFYLGYFYSPVIDLSIISHLKVSFEAKAPEGFSDLQITCSVLYDGALTGPVFLIADIPGTTGFQTYSGTAFFDRENYLTARIKFKMTSLNGLDVRFRHLSLRELSDWTGSMDSDWNNESNWSQGIPGIKSEVVIPFSAHNPVLNAEGSAAELRLEDNASLTLVPGAKLSVGKLLVNPSGPEGLIIEDGGSLILPNEGVNASFKKYIPSADWNDSSDGWHLIASPVENQQINEDWTPWGVGNDYDFYAWSEPLELWQNQKEESNGITHFMPGQGYLVAYQKGGNKYFAGPLNTRNLTQTLNRTNGNEFSGWNLLGNPYSSAILWNHDSRLWGDLQSKNINAYARIWNESQKSYSVIYPGGLIPAASGFMVNVTDGSETSLTFPAAARTHPTSSSEKLSGNSLIRLAAIEQNQASVQENILMLNPNATENYHPYQDAGFLPGYAPSFYSMKENKKLSVLCLPDWDKDRVIPLGFEKNNGNFFNIALAENNSPNSLYLFDRKLNKEHTLDIENPYGFVSENGDDPQRFFLKFQPAAPTVNNQPVMPKPPLIHFAESVLYVDFQGEAWGTSLEILDLSGRRIAVFVTNSEYEQCFLPQLRDGLYLVRISGRKRVFTGKIWVH